jgi:hypothetical protein
MPRSLVARSLPVCASVLLAVACQGVATDSTGGAPPANPPVTGGQTPPGASGPIDRPTPGQPPPASPAGPGVNRPQGLPCEVQAIVQARCAGCHASPPLYGAPMSLLNPSQFQETASTKQKIWQEARTRLSAGTMPPAGATPLTDAEKATLLAWLERAAPPAPEGASCATPPPRPMPEPQLDCQPNHTFLSTGTNPAEGFTVPPEANHYQCFNLPVPFEPQEQAVQWGPVVGDPRVVHHWILYAVKGTASNCNQLKRFVVGWAPGGTAQKLQPDIGLELPNSDERLLLEVHYHNPRLFAGIKDKTGVAMCTIKTPRPIEAGVITLGTTSIRIPARSTNVEVKGSCDAFQTRQFSGPLHLLTSFPHMHERGVRFVTSIQRGGATVPVVEVRQWDFNHQVAYPHDPAALVLNPGDTASTSCFYSNPQDREVRFGEKTEDEMCFNFLTVYPISAARSLNLRPLRLCNGFGLPGLGL